MATAVDKALCVLCGKKKIAYKCEGCSQSFCVNHLVEHRQQLDKQFDELEYQRNLFRQTISEQTTNPHHHSLVQQINQWEKDSLENIRQTADETRQMILKYTNDHFKEIEMKLIKLTEEIKEIRKENDFNENSLKKLKEKLKELEEEFNKPSNIQIQHNSSSSSFVNQVSVIISSDQSKQNLEEYVNNQDSSSLVIVPRKQLNIPINAKWAENGVSVAGGNGRGNELNQLYCPSGIYVDDDQTIYVADTSNDRIIEWKNGATSGQVVAGGNGGGNRNDQLNGPRNVTIDKENDSLIISDTDNQRVVRWPRRNGRSGETIIANVDCWCVAIDNNGYLYVPDWQKHEVRRWKIGETEGTLVAGGNGRGNGLNQLSEPYYIFVDEDQSVYVSDLANHRVMKWLKGANEGVIVPVNQDLRNSLVRLASPRGIIVDQLGTVFVVNQSDERVMRWLKGSREGSIIAGGNGQGSQGNQFFTPLGISFDRQNNLYVADFKNHRIQKFNIQS